MTASLDWAYLLAQVDWVRRRRDMTWAGIAAAADVPPPTIWRLAKGKPVSAGVLVPVLAWAGITNLRDLLSRSSRPAAPDPPELGSRWLGNSPLTVLVGPETARRIDKLAAQRISRTWAGRPSRAGMIRILLAYALEHMPQGWPQDDEEIAE